MLWLVAVGIEHIQWTPSNHIPGSPMGPSPYLGTLGVLGGGVWAGAPTVGAGPRYRDRQTAAVIGLLVFSHWLLDFLGHAPTCR